jgi:hypothetical protein
VHKKSLNPELRVAGKRSLGCMKQDEPRFFWKRGS